MKKESGFTLIELLVVVVIIGILAAISGLIYSTVIRNNRNSMQRPRLEQYLVAQGNYRNSGARRYGTFAQLCGKGLLNDSVVKVDAACNQTALNGWIIVPGDESAAFLREHFFAVLKYENRPPGDTTPIFCVGDDGVLRRSDADSLNSCTLSSTPVEP